MLPSPSSPSISWGFLVSLRSPGTARFSKCHKRTLAYLGCPGIYLAPGSCQHFWALLGFLMSVGYPDTIGVSENHKGPSIFLEFPSVTQGITQVPKESWCPQTSLGVMAALSHGITAGTAVLRSVEPVALGRWHRVTAERLHKDGTMTVDGSAPVQRSSPGKSQGLNLHSPLYLGGVEPPLRPPTNASFQGCIGEVSPLRIGAGCPRCRVPWLKPLCLAQVSINGKKVDLSYSFLRSRGVGQCGQSSPCLHAPCLHGGRCLPLPAGSPPFRCLCTPGFSGECRGAGCVCAACAWCVRSVLCCACERVQEVPRPCVPVSPCATTVSPGPRCERVADRCLEHNPCLHSGTCKDNGCVCPEGYGGPYCQHGELGVRGHGHMWG